MKDENDGAVDSRVASVDRTVSVEDSSSIVTVMGHMLEQCAVRAVAGLVNFPGFVDVVEPSTIGRLLGILSDSLASLLTDSDMDGLRTIYGILDSIELRAPKEHEQEDWDVPGWTCFYECTLRLGFRFPVLFLVRRLLYYYDIAPSQLMSNIWRILLGVLCERYNLRFGLGSLLHNYYLKEHVSDSGHYMLISRSKGN